MSSSPVVPTTSIIVILLIQRFQEEWNSTSIAYEIRRDGIFMVEVHQNQTIVIITNAINITTAATADQFPFPVVGVIVLLISDGNQ